MHSVSETACLTLVLDLVLDLVMFTGFPQIQTISHHFISSPFDFLCTLTGKL